MNRLRKPMRAVAVPVLVAAAMALAAPGPANAAPGAGTRFTVATTATAVAARTDRRPDAGGVYDQAGQQTFISWGGLHEDNYVQSYDHRTGSWSAPVKVGDGADDSHNYPTMVLAPDGHLLVFHNLHNTQLIVERSALPHSIAGQWTEQVIAAGDGATYPMPFVTDSGAILVFIRETVHDLDKNAAVDWRPMKYVRSLDNGLTWSNTFQLTGDKYAISPVNRPDNMNEIYIGQLRYVSGGRGRPDRVLIVYTLAGGGPEGHLHDRYHKNLYYTYFTPGDLHFHAADGRDLGTRIDDAEQEAYLKVADTPLQVGTLFPRTPDYISLVGEVAGVRPFVVWMRIDPTGLVHDFTSMDTPTGWRSTEVATGLHVREAEPVDALTWRVYATDDTAVSGIKTYLVTAGAWWRAEADIDTPHAVQRIELITNGQDPARILATGASSARDVTTADGDVYVAGFPQ